MSRDTRLPHHARRLIERGWTQHADARAADNTVVHPCDRRAVSWSLLGALVAAVEHVSATDGERTAIGQLTSTCVLLAGILDTDSLEQWNDARGRSRDDVVAALDRVAAGVPDERRFPSN